MAGALANASDVDVEDYVSRIGSAGGTISAASKREVVRLVKRLKDVAVWTSIHRLNVFAGDFAACLVPLKKDGGTGNTTDTNNNFVTGDFNEATTGLRAASGNTKYLQTGYIPNTAGLTNSNYHGMAFLLDDLDTADANSAPFFATNTSPNTEIGAGSSAVATGYNGKNTAPYLGPGCFMFSCRSTGVQVINGYHIARYMPGSAPTTLGGAAELLLFSGFKSSAQRTGWGALGAYSIGPSLTDQQMRDYQAALHSFQYAMGRMSKKPLCVAFGDSITRGYLMTAASQRWSRQFANNRGEREINYGVDNRRTNADYTAGNPYAIGAMNSYTDIIQCLLVKPQTVCIQLGVNDLYDDSAVSGTQATADTYRDNLKTIIQYCLDHGVLAANIYVGSPSYGTDSHFGNATKGTMYATSASDAASSKGVKYVPIYEASSTDAAYTLQLDGIHPTSGGQTVMGKTYTAAG